MVFRSSQSYYDLLSQAGYRWKKTQARSPQADPQAGIARRAEIKKLAAHKEDLQAGRLRAFFVDESHLHWGDACGYAWGRSGQRRTVCIENERQRQTYYGALDGVKGTFLMQSYPKANSQHTVDFIRYIQQRRPGQQVLIFWDGASYHYQQAMRAFLKTIQAHRPTDEWKVRCMRCSPLYTTRKSHRRYLVKRENLCAYSCVVDHKL